MVLAKILNNMNWLKENWFKLFLVIIVIAVGYFWFMRPIILKKYCARKSFELAKGSLSNFDEIYKICLKKYGL